MNWDLFFLNQLMEEIILVQEGIIPFPYSWLLILIALVGWMEPKYCKGIDIEAVNISRGAWYKNIWVLM